MGWKLSFKYPNELFCVFEPLRGAKKAWISYIGPNLGIWLKITQNLPRKYALGLSFDVTRLNSLKIIVLLAAYYEVRLLFMQRVPLQL